MTHLLFVKLGDDVLTEGALIDGILPGTFLPMRGGKVEITEEQIPEMFTNTLAAIEATKSEAGEIVGLPIDAKGHEEGDGAGWIVGAEMDGDLIRLVVKWTKIGVDLIENEIRRFFSATIDNVHNAIMGGSLTNWPATLDIKTGQRLLRPIELAHLSQDIYQFTEDESLDEVTSRVRNAWWDQESEREGEESWVVEVFESYVVIERSDGYFKVEFSEEDDEYTFAEQAEWVKVKKSWIELARETARRILAKLTSQEVSIEENESDDNDTNELGANDPSTISKGDEIMTVKLEELSAEDQASLVTQLAAALGVSPDPATSEDVGAPIAMLQGHIEARIAAGVKDTLAQAEAEAEIVKLAAGMVGGTEKNTAGLPVTEDVMTDFLKSLDAEQRETAVGILEKIRAEGLVGFSERGHKKRVEGKTELDGEMKVLLRSYLEEDEKGTVTQFFEINAADLGPMKDYDLVEFESKKEGE